MTVVLIVWASLPVVARGQAADWQDVVWREPQVRYLLADISLGGDIGMYRKYAIEERDPDSREAVRLWDAGARVVNLKEFERKWVKNPYGKDGKVMRVVLRNSDRTIAGTEILLSTDLTYEQAMVRRVLAELSLGASAADYDSRKADTSVTEALRRWRDGARVVNSNWFQLTETNGSKQLAYRDTTTPADGVRVRLNSDAPYPETNVRYFLADMYLGGSRDFYARVAQSAHEMGCLEAVARYDGGVTITNLDQLERKKVDGKVVICLKGTDQRIKGSDVKLSTD
jgi:hypothetical protein